MMHTFSLHPRLTAWLYIPYLACASSAHTIIHAELAAHGFDLRALPAVLSPAAPAAAASTQYAWGWGGGGWVDKHKRCHRWATLMGQWPSMWASFGPQTERSRCDHSRRWCGSVSVDVGRAVAVAGKPPAGAVLQRWQSRGLHSQGSNAVVCVLCYIRQQGLALIPGACYQDPRW